MPERESLLLVSKLSAPPWRPHWVPRPRLLLHTAPDAGARLLLCAAPAGFGKTTALIACAEQRRAAGAAVAWYTLDPADNDPARFAAYLIGAFAQADARLPLATHQAHAGADIEQLLIGLLNLLGAADRPYLLVLDDYHLIQAPAIHRAVALLIEQLPDHVQLAIGTRADPPLPLARLRVRGQLAELRAAELQFNLAEATAFFTQRAGRPLSAHALEQLTAWSEGWAAGLQLVALALPRAPNGEATIEQMVAGSQRHVFTFLADEVFGQQPPEVQMFLLGTSVVDHLTPELCDALLRDGGGRMRENAIAVGMRHTEAATAPSASAILEQLEQANLFLVQLDPTRPWYRYHHLFSDFLRHRLDRTQPGRRALLHRRAARWYADMGEVTQAVNHALAAGDAVYAADLIVRVAARRLGASGEIATLLGWAERFSHAQLAATPWLCLTFGRAAYLSQHAALAERFFTLTEQGLASAEPGAEQIAGIRMRLMIFRAAAASLNGEIGSAAAWLAAATPMIPADDPETLAAHASATGVNHLLRGDLSAAGAAFTQMGAIARPANLTYFAADAVGLLALVDLLAGRLGAAEERCTALLAGFGSDLPALPALGLVLARLGAVAYHRGQLDRAAQLFRQGGQVGRRSLGRADRQIWPWLVRIAAAQRDAAGLRALLAEDEGQRAATGDAVLTGLCMAARAEGLLALGAVDEAWHWAQHCSQLPGEQERDQEALAVARVLLVRRRPTAALARLEGLIAAVEAGGRTGHLIEALAVQARALYDLQRLPEAQAALQRALALAEPEGYVQVFLDEGPAIAALLGRMQEADGAAHPYLLQLLAAFPDGGAQPRAPSQQQPAPFRLPPFPEPLTEREREVLRLLAAGATNQDIADTLVITVGTAKTHLNHILGKLGARNRTEAVARARTLGIL